MVLSSPAEPTAVSRGTFKLSSALWLKLCKRLPELCLKAKLSEGGELSRFV